MGQILKAADLGQLNSQCWRFIGRPQSWERIFVFWKQEIWGVKKCGHFQGWLQGGGCIHPHQHENVCFYIVDLYDSCHFTDTIATSHLRKSHQTPSPHENFLEPPLDIFNVFVGPQLGKISLWRTLFNNMCRHFAGLTVPLVLIIEQKQWFQ